MRFAVRFAMQECRRRIATTLMVSGITATAVIAVVLSGSLSSAAMRAREAALQPLTSSGVDMVVSTIATSVAEGSGSVSLDPRLLDPGEPFVQDSARIAAFSPMPESGVERVIASEHVRRSESLQVVVVDRLSGVAPARIVAPERTVEPLTDSEEAQLDESLAADAEYSSVSRQFLSLRALIADGTASRAQEERARQLGQKLTDIEFSHYPPRFHAFARETFTPEPVRASESRIVVVGMHATHAGLLLDTDDVTAGRLPAAQSNEVALGESFARATAAGIGDRVPLLGTQRVVVGVVDPPVGGVSGDVYAPFETVSGLTGSSAPNALLVEVQGAENAEGLRDAVRTAIPEAHIYEVDNASAQLIGGLSKAEDGIRSHLAALQVALAVGTAGALAIVLVSTVAGRRREMGTLTALGWSRARVCGQIALECALRCALGIVAGTATAMAVASLFAAYSGPVTISIVDAGGAAQDLAVRLQPTTPWSVVGATGLAAIATCGLAAVLVSWASIRRPPAVLLTIDSE